MRNIENKIEHHTRTGKIFRCYKEFIIKYLPDKNNSRVNSIEVCPGGIIFQFRLSKNCYSKYGFYLTSIC